VANNASLRFSGSMVTLDGSAGLHDRIPVRSIGAHRSS